MSQSNRSEREIPAGSKKVVLLAFTSIVTTVLVCSFFYFTPAADFLQNASPARALEAVPEDPEGVGEGAVLPINGAQNEAIPDGLKRLQENLAWKRSRGYFTPADHESYASYDVKVLEALAAGGDLLASSVLVHGYIEGRFTEDASGQLPDKTHELWREGIVIGSTRAIAGAALRAEGAALNHEDPHSPESKQDFMEALAWYELGYLRGDRDVLRSGLALARQFDLSFSPEEKMEIHRRAKRLYRELEAERVLRGFGPFDNSRPPAVTNWELFPRPNDWGSNYYDDVVAEYKALQSP